MDAHKIFNRALRSTLQPFIFCSVFDYLRQQLSDLAQQAFSSDGTPTLSTGLPALEALHNAWNSRSTRPKYIWFRAAIEAAASKIDEYYNKTSTSHAYTFFMCSYIIFCSVGLGVAHITHSTWSRYKNDTFQETLGFGTSRRSSQDRRRNCLFFS